MSDINSLVSGNTGSTNVDPAVASGQSTDNNATNYEEAYKELESKMGKMGTELGEYRTFFQNISPVLEKLDANPEVVQAIVDGKLDSQLAKAVLEGRVTIGDAQIVTEANKAVQKEVSKTGESLSSKDIEALVEKKAIEIRRELEEKEEMSSFQEKTEKFIESTPDFLDYADAVNTWIDEHDITDIEVAYWAVKGKLSDAEAKKLASTVEAEKAKEYALNAQGGGVISNKTPEGQSVIDSLIGGHTNPLI
jgi:DNA-binding ferritin-like protein (Dps family)